MIVTRSARKFSLIAIDQSHEQTNKLIKGSGGAVCDDDPIFDHHEQSPTFDFDYSYPYWIKHPNLLKLVTKEICDVQFKSQ